MDNVGTGDPTPYGAASEDAEEVRVTGMSLYDGVRRRRRTRLLVGVAVVVLVAGGGLLAWWFLRDVPEDPALVAGAFASGWAGGSIADVALVDAADDPDAALDELTGGLGAEPPAVEVVEVDDPAADDDPLHTTATLEVTWTVAQGRTWTYETTADLVRAEDELTWSVRWDPTLVHPELAAGLRLRADRTQPERGDVLAADGSAIVTEREVVDVGIQRSRAEDLGTLVDDLTDALSDVLGVEIDAASLRDRVEEAGEDQFVQVVTLRRPDYDQVRERIFPLPGTVFNERTTPLAPSREFARFTLGTVGAVTAEMIEEQPDRYVAGDVAGRGGLQGAYDERLFGTPGVRVLLVGEDAPDDPVLFAEDPVPGESVTVTLDPRVQRAADAAVQGTDHATALAVVRPSDGHVLALANSDEATFDIARTGQLPPGSTFKVVTTAALLSQTDLTPDTSVECPPQTVIDGRPIPNAESQQLGTVPFRTVFANSCNTAFAQLSQDLSPTALQEAGRWFGLGQDPSIGLPAFGGQVPETTGATDLAESAIGQGRILASPLAMARLMGTVAEGRPPPLSLLLEPAPEEDAGTPDALPNGIADTLDRLTRLVVTDGTATSMQDVPGGPVHGKTGTAEFDDEDGNRRTHAWFMGFQGDLAFAVVVTDTDNGFGGELAAPVARDLLTTLADADG